MSRSSLAMLVVTGLAGGCSTPEPVEPVQRSWGAEKLTQVQRYRVEMALDPEPPELGELFVAKARVSLPDGTRVPTAVVTLDARMPQHDHGMETRPVMRDGVDEAGWYVADGFKFHMGGDWTLYVRIEGPGGPDSTTFVYGVP